MVVVARDVTARARAEAERERLLHRAAFLAEASAAFDEVLDEEATLDALARLSVRELADTCVILLGRSAGSIRRVATVARDPDDERHLRELVERYPFADRRSHPLLEVLATGRARLVEHPDGADIPVVDERHRELVAEFATQSTLLVPLTARGRSLGVMALGFNSLVGDDHLSLFEDVARRGALAIDNARLYEERAKVARTLQRSLLPPALPHVPGVELAARYHAAGEGNEVGGDFYDCFPTGDGDWALVIGDVCGKGAEAAAVTALARYTVRASATLHSDRPQVVLEDLNDAIRREGGTDSRFCTVLYISLRPRPDGVKACVATGGHPLPLLMRADGSVETAGRARHAAGHPARPRDPLDRDRPAARRHARPLHGRRDRGQPARRPLRARDPRRVRGGLRGPRGAGDRPPDRGAGARDRRRLGPGRRRRRRPARLPRRRRRRLSRTSRG